MSRRRHKKTPVVIDITSPAKPPDVLEWDQKLSTLAFAVNDVAITHRNQIEAVRKAIRSADFSVPALQETLEKCRDDRQELQSLLQAERQNHQEFVSGVKEILDRGVID